MINQRPLARDEIELVWSIDRSEVIDSIYYLDHGDLKLRSEHYDMKGWPPGEAEKYTPILIACYDHGGWFYGLFDDDILFGVAVLANEFIGNNGDLLQLKFLHVSTEYRHQGWGQQLFELARVEAVRRGAGGMYISATPSEHTINFYIRLGCLVSAHPDSVLYAMEPEDIHLEYVVV